MTQIDYGQLSDRELLIVVVHTCNETNNHLKQLNNKVANNAERIDMLEDKVLVIETTEVAKLSLNKRQAVGWGSTAIAIITVIVVIASKLLEMWW